MRNNYGISYIETLVSAAILSMILIPLVAGFSYTNSAFHKSEEIYVAGLNCSNILLSAERSLKAGSFTGAGTMKDFLNAADFPEAYSMDKFDYAVHISELDPAGSVLNTVTLTTGEIYAEVPDTSLSIENLTLTSAMDFENLIVYDGGFDVSSCPFGEADGNSCKISIPQLQPYTAVNFDARRLSSPVKVSLENLSSEILTLNIFCGEDVRELISIEYLGETQGVAVSFRDFHVGESYLVTAEVYGKDSRLISRMAKLI